MAFIRNLSEKSQARKMPKNADAFSVMEGRCDGYPVVAMINSQLRDYKAQGSMPWFFSFSTELTHATLEGLPTAQEADALNRWEDVIDRLISRLSKDLFVGRVSWKGNRELLYYADRPEPVATEIQKLIDTGTTRPFAFRHVEDPAWSNVSIYLR
jgi:hypothetical protein